MDIGVRRNILPQVFLHHHAVIMQIRILCTTVAFTFAYLNEVTSTIDSNIQDTGAIRTDLKRHLHIHEISLAKRRSLP